MEYVVGLTLALIFCAAAAALGMDRERVFYPAVVMTVASYYLAFAVTDGSVEVMLREVSIAAVFIVGAVLGFKRNPWIAVIALGGHGVMDIFHHHLVHNGGVPRSWPGFCATFDVAAAVFVALLTLVRARPAAQPLDRGADDQMARSSHHRRSHITLHLYSVRMPAGRTACESVESGAAALSPSQSPWCWPR